MKNKNKILLGTLLVALTLAGCQQFKEQRIDYVRNRSFDYISSRTIAPLRIPEGLSTPPHDDTYPLPAHAPQPGTQTKVSLVPPGFGQLSSQ